MIIYKLSKGFYFSHSMLIRENDKVMYDQTKVDNQKVQGFIPEMLMKINHKLNMLLMMNRNNLKGNGTFKSRFNSSRTSNPKIFQNNLNRYTIKN